LQSFPTTHEHPVEFDPNKLFSEEAVPDFTEFIGKVNDDVKRLAKPKETKMDLDSDNSLHFVEEHTLETEKGERNSHFRSIP